MENRKNLTFNGDMAEFFLSSNDQNKSENDLFNNQKDIYTLPIKRKNVKQPKDSSENNGPISEDDLIQILSKALPDLRNASGTIYKNSPLRCLQGICRMPIFNVKDRYWQLDESEAAEYRAKFLNRDKKKRKVTDVTQKTEKKGEKIVNLLKNYSSSLAKDPRTQNLVKNPLSQLNGNEDLQEAAEKIGYERLIGVLQAYSVVSKHFLSVMRKEQSSMQLNNIEKDIEGIYLKLSRIEEHFLKNHENTDA